MIPPTEKLIPLTDLPSRYPSARAGKRLHPATVYRWVNRGVRGVKLEATRLGGGLYTSVEAVARFMDRLATAKTPAAATSSSRSPGRAAELAEEALDELGI